MLRKRSANAASKNKDEMRKKLASVFDYSILLRPVVTEKSSTLNAERNTTVFRVDPRASKDDIRMAVERIFKVEVASVRTVNYQGKVKRRSRSIGRRAGYKKAYVTVKEGHRIDVVEGV